MNDQVMDQIDNRLIKASKKFLYVILTHSDFDLKIFLKQKVLDIAFEKICSDYVTVRGLFHTNLELLPANN